MYADDVTLVSSDPVEVQQLLDVLYVFCRIFDMEVNWLLTRLASLCSGGRALAWFPAVVSWL
jgi:hypothetical protein